MTEKRKIILYDTTLRDGAQTVGISFSLMDKIRIAQALDRLKIDYIEGGWPGSNPKDDQFFEEIKKVSLSHSKIAAFGSTRRYNKSAKDDPMLDALIKSGAGTITIVAKSWDFHVEKAFKIEPGENLKMIEETVRFLKKLGLEVFLDAEHYYDGYRSNSSYALDCLKAGVDAGADMIYLCDTNGGFLPGAAAEITRNTIDKIKAPAGVHFHNDSGVALANSLVCVEAGALSVQGTVNGYGERCGNCDIIPLIPCLTLKMGLECSASDSLIHLTEISRLISETANLPHDEKAPFAGNDAFAHKGGIHVSALLQDTRTYEHIDPSLVGNRRKVLVSELSGKSSIEFKARDLNIDLGKNKELAEKILKRIKCLEDKGFQFEAAEGSLELLLREATGEYRPFFKLHGFRVITEMKSGKDMVCEATIMVEVGGTVEHSAANGKGPVEALDNALRKSLEKFYPELQRMKLADYKVRVLNEKSGTSSSVRVLIDQKDGADHWGTVGVSANIIEASWQALVDGIEYMLFKNEGKK